jgi:hypothetical protein
MGIFSRLFNRRPDGSTEDGEAEQQDEAATAGDDAASQTHTIEGVSPDEAMLPELPPDRPSQDSISRRGLQLDPLDPADFEVRTKSGRKRLLSVREESDPPPPNPEEIEELEELEPVETLETVVEQVVQAEPPPLTRKLTPQPIDVDQLFGPDSEPGRPPLPSKPELVDDGDDLDAALERGFAASRRRTSRPSMNAVAADSGDSVTTESDLAQVRDLFHDMATHYVGQVRDFMLELRRADAAAIWIPLCEPVVQRLRSMCETLTMPEVSSALGDFGGALERAKNAPGGVVQGAEREAVLASYDRLIELLPRAFDVNDTGREAIIVELLLLQIPGVRHLTLEKLYRAGISQFDSFLRADPGELAAVSGIDVTLAEQIVRRFREYRQSVTGVLAEPEPDVERNRLVPLVAQLREQHDGYEKASARWSDEAKADKRRLRRERLETLSQVYVVLARLGEVDRVARLKKMGVEWQLKDLEGYLREFNAGAPSV